MTVAIEIGRTATGDPAAFGPRGIWPRACWCKAIPVPANPANIRRLLEQSIPWVQQTVIDPVSDFVTLAEQFGHLVIDAEEHTERGLQVAGERVRLHRVSTVLNLEGLDAENQMRGAATSARRPFRCRPSDHWYPMLVVVDEAQLFAPAVAGEVSDEARKLSLNAMTNLMCRGRKRGLAGIIATQRLAKRKNVAAEAAVFP